MLPILNAEQIKKIDSYTILKEPITSIDLMERAATNCYEKITKKTKNKNGIIHIFCGLGNNGGDGLVIAKRYLEEKRDVCIYKLYWGQKPSNDFELNEKRLASLDVLIKVIESTSDFPKIKKNDIVIDAIWGIGLSRPIENFAADIIALINQSKALIISIDTPSGLPVTPSFEIDQETIVKANYTYTFHLPKLSFLLPQTGNYAGDFTIVPIGLDNDFIKEQKTDHFYIDKNYINEIIKKRQKFSHKGSYGHALIVAGSMGKIGAAVLAAKSCLKSGVGLLSVHSPECGYDILQKSIPEAMVIRDSGKSYIEDIIDLYRYSSIGIGPGIDQKDQTELLLSSMLEQYNKPIVIDADAINIISQNKDLINKIPKYSILSPHPGEFKRLVGDFERDMDRLESLRQFSINHSLYVILKGAHTAIACPNGKVLFNSTGNPGMATAGSGDVLTGIITSFLSQGYDSEDASVLSVYFHGLSGDISKEKVGELSLNASDIVSNISEAFKLF
tara:strand:+ start:61 stop:1569 length:1509 start_codon:yes stop_codon:yes gene_type:complete